MLALTENAAEAVEKIVSQPEVPESAVVRISSEEDTEPGNGASPELKFTLASEPEDDDVVVEGIRISVEPDALDFLDDKVLDAELAEGSVQFSLYMQPPGASFNGTGAAPGDA